MLLNQRIDKENVTHLHITVAVRCKKKNNDILKFECKWNKLDKTILSEVNQTKKDEYGILTFISGY